MKMLLAILSLALLAAVCEHGEAAAARREQLDAPDVLSDQDETEPYEDNLENEDQAYDSEDQLKGPLTDFGRLGQDESLDEEGDEYIVEEQDGPSEQLTGPERSVDLEQLDELEQALDNMDEKTEEDQDEKMEEDLEEKTEEDPEEKMEEDLGEQVIDDLPEDPKNKRWIAVLSEPNRRLYCAYSGYPCDRETHFSYGCQDGFCWSQCDVFYSWKEWCWTTDIRTDNWVTCSRNSQCSVAAHGVCSAWDCIV